MADLAVACRTARIIGLATAASVVACAVVTMAVSRIMSAPALAAQANAVTLVAVVAALTLFAAAHALPRRMLARPTPPGEAALERRLQAAAIVGFALSEAIAVVALLLGLLTGRVGPAMAMMAFALVSIAVDFPRLERWQELAREHARQAPRRA